MINYELTIHISDLANLIVCPLCSSVTLESLHVVTHVISLSPSNQGGLWTQGSVHDQKFKKGSAKCHRDVDNFKRKKYIYKLLKWQNIKRHDWGEICWNCYSFLKTAGQSQSYRLFVPPWFYMMYFFTLDLPSSSFSSSCPRHPCPSCPSWSDLPHCLCSTCFLMNAAVLSAGLETVAEVSLYLFIELDWYVTWCHKWLEIMASWNMFHSWLFYTILIFASKAWFLYVCILM